MSLTIIDGNKSYENYSNVKRLSRKKKRKKETILKIISEKGITLEDFRFHPIFQTLDKNDKNLFRYHLKRLSTKNEVRVSTRVKKRKKIRRSNKKSINLTKSLIAKEGFKFSLFLMIEAAILNFSHHFYLKLGVTLAWAWVFAFLVEGTFSVFASEKSFASKGLKTIVFLFSAFTVCYGSFVNDKGLKRKLNWDAVNIKSKEEHINQLERQLSRRSLEQENQKNNILKKEDAIQSQINQLDRRIEEYRSQGNKNLIKRLSIERYSKLEEKIALRNQKNSSLDRNTSQIENKIRTLKDEITNLRKEKSTKKIISWKNFKSLELNTYVWMALMLILQVASAFFIKSVSETASAFAKKARKKRDSRERFLRRNINIH